MARPRQQWRREQILDAAQGVLSRSGVAALKVADVAQAAGVSTGTVHYHFADLEGVFLGVVERATEQMYHQRLAAIEQVPALPEKLSTLIRLGIPDVTSPELVMMYEGIGVLRSRPEYRALARSYVERQVGLYRSVLDAGVFAGVFEPTTEVGVVARNLLALEDAYGMYLVLGIQSDGRLARANVIAYANAALGVVLG